MSNRKPMTATDQRRLWVNAHGLCSNPSCRRKLIVEPTEFDRATSTGKQAHVVAHSIGGPRGDGDVPVGERDTYENMILLCGNCHDFVDGQPNTYTGEVLHGWKQSHEGWIESCVQQSMTSIQFEDLEEVTSRFIQGELTQSTPEVAMNIAEKIKKNRLTERSVRLLRMGVAGAQIAGAYIHDLERERPGFGQRLRHGFLQYYSQGIVDKKEPDDIFSDLVEVSANHSTDFQKKAAGLAVLGYLFTICEVFES